MPITFSTKKINPANRGKFDNVFNLHKQPSIHESFKSTSYYLNDKNSIHIEICVPHKKFIPYAILNTSISEEFKEITIMITDDTNRRHRNNPKKDYILSLDFTLDDLQNINHRAFPNINSDDSIEIVIINDKLDLKKYKINPLESFDLNKDKATSFLEPKEVGGGVIVEGP